MAPFSRQAGKWQGKEQIQGGRASVRRAVYLPAVVATHFKPDLKAKNEQLVSTGKRKNWLSQQLCANSSLWQMRCCAAVENGVNILLYLYGYSAIA
ncbi:transposase [Oceaniovalibus sp. ACAM 378]|uniref:transposase n=1 Tax=Oceaniovalibus sp. ACAM 378 TaxID=2599923 RepID=UPI002107F2CB|nr:transposase [Oceaniovalibus sp. ACAM 378]